MGGCSFGKTTEAMENTKKSHRRPGESRDPLIRYRDVDEWIPAFAGATVEIEFSMLPW
jgi:hypothetical protein